MSFRTTKLKDRPSFQEMLSEILKNGKAAKRAIPNLEEIKELKEQIADNEKELAKIKKAKRNLIEAINEYGIDPDINEEMVKHRERQDSLKAENRSIKAKLEEIPTEQAITRKAKQLKKVVASFSGKKNLQYLSAAFPQLVFSSFGSWFRTIRSDFSPSEQVAAIALRNTFPEFLSDSSKDSIFEKFLLERIDLDRTEGLRLVA